MLANLILIWFFTQTPLQPITNDSSSSRGYQLALVQGGRSELNVLLTTVTATAVEAAEVEVAVQNKVQKMEK